MARADSVFSADFEDGKLKGWTASGGGKWSAADKRLHHTPVGGQAGKIEHAIKLNNDAWSVEFDAGWKWGSGNPGIILALRAVDFGGNGYIANFVQTGEISLIKKNKGQSSTLATCNPGKLAGGPLERYRLSYSEGILAFSLRLGDKWFDLMQTADATNTKFTKIVLAETSGEGNAIFDNIVVSKGVQEKTSVQETAKPRQALMSMNPEQFYIQPDTETELVFIMAAKPSFFHKGSLSYYITDYRDRLVGKGSAGWRGGVVKLKTTLKQGYYSLVFPSTSQTFGIQSIPAAEGEADLFFGMDAAMSWFIDPQRNLREGMLKALTRNGIKSVRERMAWNRIEEEQGNFDWETGDRQYETLRKTYADHGVKLLELNELTPGWNDPAGKGGVHLFVQDLSNTVRSWETIAGRWGKYWAQFEIWNEPDNNAYFNGGTHEKRGVPADQYTQLAKAISYAFHKAGVKTPLLGGCFSISLLASDFPTAPSAYHRSAAENGLLDYVDAVSYHTYSPASAVQSQTVGMRNWLAGYGKESMPIYLSESGVVPWSDGETELAQTAGLAMKMIESKVCGLARFYAFVYPPLPGGKNWRFGLSNYNGSPRMALAGYVQAVHALSNKDYIGDLPVGDSSVKLARVFAGEDGDAVAVIFAGKTNPDQRIGIDLPVKRIEGADGRVLEAGNGGRVPIPDGLVYVYLNRSDVEPVLDRNTKAMHLWNIAKQPVPERSVPSPIILQPRLDEKIIAPTYMGYRVLANAPAANLPVQVEVFNLSDQPQKMELTLSGMKGASLDRISVEVPAMGSKSVVFHADIAAVYKPGQKQVLRVDAKCDGLATTPLVMDLMREPAMKELLECFPSARPLPVADLKHWSSKGNDAGKLSKTEEGNCRMDGGASLVFAVPSKANVADADGLVVRMKCLKTAKIHLTVVDAKGRTQRYPTENFMGSDRVAQSTSTLIHPDGQWHAAYVPLSALGLDGVREITIGYNKGKGNALEISDLVLVKE